jgi:hypothetical protein
MMLFCLMLRPSSAMDLDPSGDNTLSQFAVFEGSQKVDLQLPVELVAGGEPAHYGVRWTWSADMIDGFDYRIPTVGFTFEEDGTGEANEYHTIALMTFDMDDWLPEESGSAAEGSFRLKLSNGTPAEDRLYSMAITMRSARSGLTIILQQTSSESCVSAGGAEAFTFTADQFDWGASGTPTTSSMILDASGQVIAFDFAAATGTEDGQFRLVVTDGDRPPSLLPGLAISLRSLVGDGYTVIEQQTSGENGVSAAGANGFFISADQFDWGANPPPTTSLITFDALGAITTFEFAGAAGYEDATFRQKYTDGTRPGSYIAGRGLSLRSLVGDGYTVIEQQTSGENGVSAAGANGFFVSADQFDWGAGSTPTTSSLAFDALGAITAYEFADATGTENGTFRQKYTDGARPGSYIAGRSLSIRSLIGTGYTVVQGQTSGGEALTAPGAVGFTISADQFDWPSPPGYSVLSLNALGRVIGYDFTGALWNEDGTFRMVLSDGARPASRVSGREILLRRLAPSSIGIPFVGSPGSLELTVAEDSGPWDWMDFTDGLSLSMLTAPDTYGSADVIISWGEGDLQAGETGDGSITLQRSSHTSPYSVVAIPISVTTATCCGIYYSGHTGNTNCSDDGAVNLADITRLIDRVYISKLDLCCEGNGDTNGDGEGPNLADITRLIDHVYISHAATAACP